MKQQTGYISDGKIIYHSDKNVIQFPVFYIASFAILTTLSNPISLQFMGGRTFGKKNRFEVAGETGSDPNRRIIAAKMVDEKCV